MGDMTRRSARPSAGLWASKTRRVPSLETGAGGAFRRPRREGTGAVRLPIWTAGRRPGVPGEAVYTQLQASRAQVSPGAVPGVSVPAGRSAAIREAPSGVPRAGDEGPQTPDRSVN